MSVAAHAALAWLAAAGTGGATPDRAAPAPPAVLIYHPPPPSAPTTAPRPGQPARRAAGPVGRAPAERPVERAGPVLDLRGVPPIGEPAPWDGAAVATAVAAELATGARGAIAGVGAPPADGVWEGASVEVEARARPGNPPPRYPPALEARGVGGEVVARFVVDSAGRVEPASLTIRRSDHPLLAESVRRALAGYRFEPARARGGPVRQLVELPFVFTPRP